LLRSPPFRNGNDADSAALLKSLMVRTGKFTIDGDKLTTDVDLSWNEILTGTSQVRFFKLEGDKLSIRTAEQASAVYPGKKVVGTLPENANAESRQLRRPRSSVDLCPCIAYADFHETRDDHCQTLVAGLLTGRPDVSLHLGRR
jgi:hypothetical protein